MMETRSRLKNWLQGGALATAIASSAPRPAWPCHDVVAGLPKASPGYDEGIFGITLGLGLGGDYWPKITYGLDFGFQIFGAAGALVRVEVQGVSGVRLIAGANVMTGGREDDCATVAHSGFAAEAGVALQSGLAWSDRGQALGLHLALGGGDPLGTVRAQGIVPLRGDRRNFSFGGATTMNLSEPWYFASGRRLREGDATLLPVAAVFSRTSDSEGELAKAWINDARTEHASIAAFVRMAAELAAVSAPDGLVRAALSAAEDEARHTQLCVAQVGTPVRLMPLPRECGEPRWDRASPEALTTLAREAWLDGCLGEGIAAAHAAHAAKTARVAEAAEAQTVIASDERRHAELAWEVLAWLWRRGDKSAREVLVTETDAAPAPGPALDTGVDPDRLAYEGRVPPDAALAVTSRETEIAYERLRRLAG